MIQASFERLRNALMQPSSVATLSLADWDLLVRQGRAADVLARLCARLNEAGLADVVPPQVFRHLQAALILAERQHSELSYELRHISAALQSSGVALVLLKGAAYVAAGLDAAHGRMVSDVDILVPRDRLAEVEAALMKAGWLSITRDAYDQQYYRNWMHEIPALRHLHRGTVLDVHHAVIPPTAGYGTDSRLLLEASVRADAVDAVRVLSEADMVLHSAVHLMHEGELEMGFRGLLDLDALVREFAGRPGFWMGLQSRALELKLQRPACLALRYVKRLLGTPVPNGILDCWRERSAGLGRVRLAALDFLFERALIPHHHSLDDRWTTWARFALYLRSHFLRMPMRLLLPHLLRKSWRRLYEGFRNEEMQDAKA